MTRFLVLAGLLVAIPGAGLAAGPIVIHRDPGCGCCEKWAEQAGQALQRPVRMLDDGNRAASRRARGVPAGVNACHTAVVDGLVIEGHVPLADVRRVLAERPKGVAGLAVAGMPLGSPGMEVPQHQVERFNVIAFGPGGNRVFAGHGG